MRKDVRDMIDLCKSLGLNPVMEGGQYKVRSESGALLFNFHQTPSDPNWHWSVMRYLRKLGLLRKSDYKKHKIGGGQVRKGKPVIDMAALKRAQDAAIAAGERPPTLEDLEDSSEIFSRSTHDEIFSVEATEESINNMSPHDAPRINATRQRLKKLIAERSDELKERGKEISAARSVDRTQGGRSMEPFRVLGYIATNEVGPKRGIRMWPTETAASTAFRNFATTQSTPRLWAVEAMEATMDHFDGLKFNEIDETRKVPAEPVVVQETLPVGDVVEAIDEPEGIVVGAEEVEALAATTDLNGYRDEYFKALVKLLNGHGSIADKKPIFERLDKLVGIDQS